mgnify:CR=1 FL=1
MKLSDLLAEIGFVHSEGDFRAEAQPPYIAWDRECDTVFADGIAVYSAEWAVLHLVHARSDYESELRVEDILTEHGIAFDKSVDWIGGDNRVWLVTYELEEGVVELE